MIPLPARLPEQMPPFVKRWALSQLFRATAEAFRCEMPSLRGLSWERCLAEYARFTADRAEAALRGGDDPAELGQRLYTGAYRLGRMPGRWLRVRSAGDVLVLGRLLYGVLDTDFRGAGSGEITISRCYFSSYYSPQVCELMSAMDHGLLAGLAGGGDLHFTQRITEGRTCCAAHFVGRAADGRSHIVFPGGRTS